MERQNMRPPVYQNQNPGGIIPPKHSSNPFSQGIIQPSNPSPWPINRPMRVVNQYANGNVPSPNPPPRVVNQSDPVSYPSGPVRHARDNLAARPAASNAPSISNNRPAGVVVAAAAAPNVGASPAARQPDNAPEQRADPQEQLPPQGNAQANPTAVVRPTVAWQVRAQYRNRSFDISPAIIPRLEGAGGTAPYYLGSPSYKKVDWNFKFEIIISPAGTPLPDGMCNFVDTFSAQDLQKAATNFIYSIFDANRRNLDIPLQFDRITRMLVMANVSIPAAAVQPAPIPAAANQRTPVPVPAVQQAPVPAAANQRTPVPVPAFQRVPAHSPAIQQAHVPAAANQRAHVPLPAVQRVPAHSPAIQQAPVPAAAVQSGPIPAAASQRVPAPVPAFQQAPVPAAANQRAHVPSQAIQQAPVPAAAIQSGPIPAAANQRAHVPLPAVQRVPAHSPAIQQAPVPAAAIQSGPIPAAANQRAHVPLPAVQRVPAHSPAIQQAPVPAAANLRAPMPAAANQRTPVLVPAFQQAPVPAAANQRAHVPSQAIQQAPVPAAAIQSGPIPAAANQRAHVPLPAVQRVPAHSPAIQQAPVPAAANLRAPMPAAANQRTPVPVPAIQQAPVPAAANLRAPMPAAANQRTPVPVPAIQQAPVPAAANQPVPIPAAANQRAPIPAAANQPVPIPAAANQRTPAPSPAIQQAPVPSPAIQQAPVPAAANQPVPIPAAANQRAPIPVAANQRTPAPSPAIQQAPVPAAAIQSGPIPAAASQRAPIPVASNQPAPIPAAAIQRAPVRNQVDIQRPQRPASADAELSYWRPRQQEIREPASHLNQEHEQEAVPLDLSQRKAATSHLEAEHEQEARPLDLSLRKAATSQATEARTSKRPAESELPSTDGPPPSKQANASTSSQQSSPRASDRIVELNAQQNEASIGCIQEQAGTSSALRRSKQKRPANATANPTSQADPQAKSQENATAPTAPVSTATGSVASTSRGPATRSRKAKLSVPTTSSQADPQAKSQANATAPTAPVSTATDQSVASTSRGPATRSSKANLSVPTTSTQADTSESESESSDSSSDQESTSNSMPGRYPKRPNVPFLPTPRKRMPINVANRAAPVSSAKDTTNDKHCWECHAAKKEKLVHCSRCSLGWHTKCRSSDNFSESKLKSLIMIPHPRRHKPESCKAYAEKQAWIRTLSSVVDPTVCSECARKEAGAYYNKHFGLLKDFEASGDRSILERSGAMYEYAVKSLKLETGMIQDKDTGEKKMGRPFEPFERIDYGKHKDMDKVDLEWLLQKAQSAIDAYQCAEEFMFDIKKICHSYMILQQKLHGFEPRTDLYKHFNEQCTRLITSALTEMDFINRCDSCYRNHYEINTVRVSTDMVMPCENPHALVWAVHRHLWWPAKVYEYRENKYFFTSNKYVHFIPFGPDSKVKWTSHELVRKFSKNPPAPSEEMLAKFAKYKPQKQEMVRANLKKALDDAKQYYRKYWDEYFTEPYPLPDNDGQITLEDLYLKVELKPSKNILDHNFILSTDDQDVLARRPVGRPRKTEQPKATTPSTQKASITRAVAGPSGVARSAKSGDKSSTKKAVKRLSPK